MATHGYERLGAYSHLGSTTVGVPSEAYKARVLRNDGSVIEGLYATGTSTASVMGRRSPGAGGGRRARRLSDRFRAQDGWRRNRRRAGRQV